MIKNWNNLLESAKKHPATPLAVAAFFFIVTLITAWQITANFKVKAIKPGKPLIQQVRSTPRVGDLNLMGTYDAKSADIPITQLQLSLQGTVVVENDPTRSQALIKSPGIETKVYKEGDVIPGNAKLERIKEHVVILNDNGQLQKLQMPINSLPNIKLSEK